MKKTTTEANMSQSPNELQEISNKYFENRQMEFSSPVDPSKPHLNVKQISFR